MTTSQRIQRGLALSCLLLGACSGGGGDWVVPAPPAEGTGELIRITGEVKFYGMEGGFYAIQDADGLIYDPTNLPAEFRQDGLAVEAEARRRDDMAGIHMAGPIVDLERIRRR